MNFTDQERIAAFDRIANEFFTHNFGTMSKTDFETLLFNIYFNHLLNVGSKTDDYTISKSLGITQSKVRSLKMKNDLRYPNETGVEWKNTFVEALKYADFDPNTRMVSVLIPEIVVQTELRNYIEEYHWFDEYPSNYKLFRCKLDIFLKICEKLSETEQIDLSSGQESKLREIKKIAGKDDPAIKKILSGNIQEGLKDLAINGTKEILCAVLDSLTFPGISGIAISTLNAVIKKS